MFDFYLSFINTKELINESYKNLLLANNNNKNLQLILSCIAIVLLAIASIITKILFGKRKKYIVNYPKQINLDI